MSWQEQYEYYMGLEFQKQDSRPLADLLRDVLNPETDKDAAYAMLCSIGTRGTLAEAGWTLLSILEAPATYAQNLRYHSADKLLTLLPGTGLEAIELSGDRAVLDALRSRKLKRVAKQLEARIGPRPQPPPGPPPSPTVKQAKAPPHGRMAQPSQTARPPAIMAADAPPSAQPRAAPTAAEHESQRSEKPPKGARSKTEPSRLPPRPPITAEIRSDTLAGAAMETMFGIGLLIGAAVAILVPIHNGMLDSALAWIAVDLITSMIAIMGAVVLIATWKRVLGIRALLAQVQPIAMYLTLTTGRNHQGREELRAYLWTEKPTSSAGYTRGYVVWKPVWIWDDIAGFDPEDNPTVLACWVYEDQQRWAYPIIQTTRGLLIAQSAIYQVYRRWARATQVRR